MCSSWLSPGIRREYSYPLAICRQGGQIGDVQYSPRCSRKQGSAPLVTLYTLPTPGIGWNTSAGIWHALFTRDRQEDGSRLGREVQRRQSSAGWWVKST